MQIKTIKEYEFYVTRMLEKKGIKADKELKTLILKAFHHGILFSGGSLKEKDI